MKRKIHWGYPILASLIAAPAMASEDLQINGFLSVGATMADSNDASIAGGDNQGGFKNDNVLGLQVQKQVNDSTKVTGQFVSRGSEDYKTEAAWAFVTYAATDDLDLRMGRLRIPFFYYSDFLEVGYAYNWVRPPEEVYRIGFSSIDGIDLTQRFSSGNFDASVQFYYGRFQGDVALNGNTVAADFRNFTGLALAGEIGNFGSRLSYHQAELIIPASAADPDPDFQYSGQTSTFLEAALTYDDGDNSIIAEWTQLEHDTSALLDDSAWLISAARRLDEFTIHATYSTQVDEYDSGANGASQKARGLGTEESSVTLGMRWDYDSSTALKFEAQHNDEKMVLGADGDSAILYSVAVDVIF
jgi:hypothetical protein